MRMVILLSPLSGALGAGLLGRFLGHKYSAKLTIFGVSLAWFISMVSYNNVMYGHYVATYKFFPWINVDALDVTWGFMFDSVTCIMCCVVTTVSLLVHNFSVDYMKEDPHLSRFMSYLSLFTFFMLMLVTANNFVQLFLGWEGVGLCSYLLINFWYTRVQANKAAIKAIIVNRFGDFGLGIALLLIFFHFKSLDFGVVFSLIHGFNESIIIFGFTFDVSFLIGFFLFLGAVGKSAQIGLHTWLPDAMEGPTPVSALIHAATMVTAGVFVLIRCSPILEQSSTLLFIISIFGALTAFFAATTGMLQNDLKKVIAYSTCSQLGYMVFTCGLSAYDLSFFHLANHAFFKALLFLSAGVIIHALADEQDMRKMGGLVNLLPFTYVMIFFGSLSLMGFPFLTGFYSKDVILEVAAASYTIEGFFCYWLGLISAFFTAFYSFRLIYLTFYAKPAGYRTVYEHAHDGTDRMIFSQLCLFFGALFYGYLSKDLFIGLGTDFWNNSIFVNPDRLIIVNSEFLPAYIKLIPFIFSLFGATLAFWLNCYYTKFLVWLKLDFFIGREIYSFLSKKWYFDQLQNHYVTKPVLNFGYTVSFKYLDRGLLELIGPVGISKLTTVISKKFSGIQSGYMFHYIFLMVFGVTFYLLAGITSQFFFEFNSLSQFFDTCVYYFLDEKIFLFSLVCFLFFDLVYLDKEKIEK